MVRGSEENESIVKIFLTGHLHIELSMQRGGILAAQCGAFEGRTNYLARKGLTPDIGAYIFDIYLDDGGRIVRTVREFFSYPEIKNDYLNYENPFVPEPDRVEPLFTLNGNGNGKTDLG